jgi:hypothetical protein
MNKTRVGQWYWLVGGGPMQVRALKHLKERNFKVILSDADEKCPGRSFADLFFQLDIHDVENHLELINGPLFELKEKILGVACIGTDSHHTVAAISEKLGTPGISRELSSQIGDKVRLRETLTKIGVYQPKFRKFSKESDLDLILNDLRQLFPINSDLIVKPLGWSASKGIRILRLSSLTRENLAIAIQSSRNGFAVIEELLIPDGKLPSESSVETFVSGGKVSFLNMVDRIFHSDLVHFKDTRIPASLNVGVEYGHINPTSRSQVEIDQIVRDLQKFVDHLQELGLSGDESFILKADILFSRNGPVILEATPRTSGGWDSSYTSPTRGMRIQELAIELSLGNSVVREEWISPASGYVAVVSDANSESIDCLGRTFFGGKLSETPSLAIASALEAKDKGLSL